MDTLIKNTKTGYRRWVAYNRQYISVTRDNGHTHYYRYSAKRIYMLFSIANEYEIASGNPVTKSK